MEIPDRKNPFHEARSPCVKCGKCSTVCPVFMAVSLESHSARGKMALIEAVSQGHLDESPHYKEYLDACLLCGACEEECPNLVPTLSIMLQAREHLASHLGMNLGEGLILKHLMRAVRVFRMVIKTGRVLQPMMFKRIPSESGLRRRFPLPIIPGDRLVPKVSKRFFTDRCYGKVKEGRGPKIGIFSGCMVDYFYPEIGQSMVDLLGILGATVIVPGDQACCGLPALTGGAIDTVRELAKRNLEAFEKYDLDVVVTGCASCGENLKENYGQVLEDQGVELERINAFVSRIRDINEFLYSFGLMELLAGLEGYGAVEDVLEVTYHSPCHLGRLQGIREEPLQLIDSIPGLKRIPMADADRCCGMGGSFSVKYYDISKEVNDRKIDRISETGARVVVTSFMSPKKYVYQFG